MPASLTQVRAGRGGRLIEIEADVLDICRRIKEIEATLGVDYNEAGRYFRVYQLIDGRKHLVTTTNELTPELVERLRRIAHPSYDLASEIERIDAEADRQRDHAFSEHVGEAAERLFHAVRKDFEMKDSIVVPRGVSDAA